MNRPGDRAAESRRPAEPLSRPDRENCMTQSRWSSVLIVITLLCLVSVRAAASAALDSLVAAERAFATRSVEQGARDAFLAYLAEDGVIFSPRATNGRQAWESRAPLTATLVWEPVFAEISAAGDLGFTTGPWELRPNDPQRPTGYGHYVSVWQKQIDGTWRVAVDIGIAHAQPARGLGNVDFTPGPLHVAPRRTARSVDLAALDLAWTRDARARGSAAAFARWAAPDVRFCRDLLPPVSGLRAGREMLLAIPGVTLWNPQAQKVARSEDLGCTYGIVERRRLGGVPPDSSVYLHVWRRGANGRWKVALALESELPKSPAR
jgi:ketosteroid isomerase-like protein